MPKLPKSAEIQVCRTGDKPKDDHNQTKLHLHGNGMIVIFEYENLICIQNRVKLLTIFAKHLILDAWQGTNYTFENIYFEPW